MADAPRLLTSSELDRAMIQVDQCRARGDETISLSPREALRWLDTLRAAWDERDELKSAMKISAALIEHVSDERDAARAALREAEWGCWRSDERASCCPVCESDERAGHAPDCLLKAALGEPAPRQGPHGAAWDERDGYREALRDAQPLICGEYCGDAYHVETCLAIRRLLGGLAGQDGG